MFLFVWQVEPIPSKPPRSFASPTTATTGKAIETVINHLERGHKNFTFIWFEKRSMINDQLPFCSNLRKGLVRAVEGLGTI